MEYTLYQKLSKIALHEQKAQGFRFYIDFPFINIHLRYFPLPILFPLVLSSFGTESILSENLPFFRLHNPLFSFLNFYPPSIYNIQHRFSACRSSRKIRVTLFLVILLLSNPWIRRYRYISRMLNAISINRKITSTAS